MKKIIFMIAASMIIITCTACSKTIELTEEQNDRIAEYIAGSMLKYDKKYESKLISYTAEPTPTNDPIPQQGMTQKQTAKPKVTEKPNQGKKNTITLSELFKDEVFKLSYESYSVLDFYKEKISGVHVDAKKDKKLAVFKLKIKNITNQAKKIDLSSKNISYMLMKNGKVKYSPLLTIMLNDIQYYEETLRAKEEKELTLIFSIDAKKIENLKLYIGKGNKNTEIDLNHN